MIEKFLTMRLMNRRATLGFGLSAAASALLPNWSASAQTRISDELQSRFLRWSRGATGFTDLPGGTARAFMERILRSGITVENLADLEPGAYRGTSLEKRLLEAWYTGVFKLDGLSEMRSYETTLMWQAAGLDPPPSTCSSGPQRWASAPSGI
jgi:D-sorbitol dehydrogenase-like protein